MISPVELRRIVSEWRLRVQRVKGILQPNSWTEQEWRQFSQALALLIREHGQSWIIDPNVYWDLRWKLQDGGDLVCQVEHVPGEKTSLVVAQSGGFASQVGSYTWLWAEFNLEGDFSRDPYWVDGTWRDALTALLLPLDRQSSYLLAGRVNTPNTVLLQEGARPNDRYFNLELMPRRAGQNGENGSPLGGDGEPLPPEAPEDETPPEEPLPPFSEETSSSNGIEMTEPEMNGELSDSLGHQSFDEAPSSAAPTAEPVFYRPSSENITEGVEPARPPRGTMNRRRRQRAQIRYHRSLPALPVRSFYRELKVVASPH